MVGDKSLETDSDSASELTGGIGTGESRYDGMELTSSIQLHDALPDGGDEGREGERKLTTRGTEGNWNEGDESCDVISGRKTCMPGQFLRVCCRRLSKSLRELT